MKLGAYKNHFSNLNGPYQRCRFIGRKHSLTTTNLDDVTCRKCLRKLLNNLKNDPWQAKKAAEILITMNLKRKFNKS